MVRKYATILMSRPDLSEFITALSVCTACLEDPNFKELIANKLISKDKKVSFILDVLDGLKVSYSKNFVNFLKLLSADEKLAYLSEIYTQISKQQELEKGVYQGVIYSKNQLNAESLKHYANKLSKYFNKEITLVNKLGKDDEIRVSLDDLGYEIILSNQLLRTKIKDFIIKAV